MNWTPGIMVQAEDRAHRIGTLKEVRVFRLVTQATIEEQILMKASYKKGLDEMVIQAGLYNNKATDLERRQRLEEVIKKQNLDREDEDEIPNDEEINKIMARDDDEFELFQELDKLRYEQEKRYYPNFNPEINYRLTVYEEIPEWIRELEEQKKDYKYLFTLYSNSEDQLAAAKDELAALCVHVEPEYDDEDEQFLYAAPPPPLLDEIDITKSRFHSFLM